MRNVIRVGAFAGIIGSLTMYVLARGAGLVVVPALLVLGLTAGLAMAKWLEWGWYGRQLEAGLKAGALACAPAGLVALLVLLTQGPHDLAALARVSRLGPLSVAPLVGALGFAGWGGADVLGVAGGVLAGMGAAALVGWLFAWSKSGRAVRTITRARAAAHALSHGAWSPSQAPGAIPAIPNTLNVGKAWQKMRPTNAPAPEVAQSWGGPLQLRSSSPAPSAGTPAGDLSLSQPSPYTPLTSQGPARHAPSPAPSGEYERTPLPSDGGGFADDSQLRAAMREALSMWGNESGEHSGAIPDEVPSDAIEDQPTQRRKRSSKESAFLNEGAAKKRGRKKQETRDWLC